MACLDLGWQDIPLVPLLIVTAWRVGILFLLAAINAGELPALLQKRPAVFCSQPHHRRHEPHPRRVKTVGQVLVEDAFWSFQLSFIQCIGLIDHQHGKTAVQRFQPAEAIEKVAKVVVHPFHPLAIGNDEWKHVRNPLHGLAQVLPVGGSGLWVRNGAGTSRVKNHIGLAVAQQPLGGKGGFDLYNVGELFLTGDLRQKFLESLRHRATRERPVGHLLGGCIEHLHPACRHTAVITAIFPVQTYRGGICLGRGLYLINFCGADVAVHRQDLGPHQGVYKGGFAGMFSANDAHRDLSTSLAEGIQRSVMLAQGDQTTAHIFCQPGDARPDGGGIFQFSLEGLERYLGSILVQGADRLQVGVFIGWAFKDEGQLVLAGAVLLTD